MENILPLLLSAGGAAFVAAIFAGVKTIRDGKIASEESVIKRLNEDAKQAHEDADIQRSGRTRAETEREAMRVERDAANERHALMRQKLIRNGIDPDGNP